MLKLLVKLLSTQAAKELAVYAEAFFVNPDYSEPQV